MVVVHIFIACTWTTSAPHPKVAFWARISVTILVLVNKGSDSLLFYGVTVLDIWSGGHQDRTPILHCGTFTTTPQDNYLALGIRYCIIATWVLHIENRKKAQVRYNLPFP